jgi:hypothetical protein
MTSTDEPKTGSGTGNRLGRALEIVLPIGATLVFVALWIIVAVDVLTDSALPDDLWAWLTGLDLIAAIVAWVLFLPIGVYLWARQAGLDDWAMALVMLGLVAWTLLALSGLRRGLWRRGR